jgi:predicted enzyme related to lactoylglutathione lyase
MEARMASGSGKFVWYELLTTDPKAAEAFYSKVFGWRMEPGKATDMAYTHINVGNYPIGGIMELPAELKAHGVPPNWSGYIGVDDVDATARKIVAAGGKVQRPAEDIPNVGRFAVVADPAGAVFLIFKGTGQDNMPARPPMGTPGFVDWNELIGGEPDESFKFYSGLFGWTKGEAMNMGAMGTYQIFHIDGVPSGGMMKRKPDMPMACWIYYVAVDDIEAAHKRVLDSGGKIMFGPMEVPGGMWIVTAFDPQQAMFAMVGPKKT